MCSFWCWRRHVLSANGFRRENSEGLASDCPGVDAVVPKKARWAGFCKTDLR